MKSGPRFFNFAVSYYSRGFNVIPLGKGKRPIASWGKWQTKIQNFNDLLSFDWSSAKGIACVCGTRKHRVIDIDHSSEPTIVETVCDRLGLPYDYKWIVSSGNGYHIHVECVDDVVELIGRRSSYYRFNCLDPRAQVIELKFSHCLLTLPPTIHPNGKRYKYINGRPQFSPSEVDSQKLFEMLIQLTDIQSRQAQEPSYGSRGVQFTYHSFNDYELEQVVGFLAGKINNYEDWIQIGFALASIGEEGREYFLRISQNVNYPKDTFQFLNAKFDRLLSSYDQDRPDRITINTLFFIAREKYGFTYGLMRTELSDNNENGEGEHNVNNEENNEEACNA